VVEKSEDRQEDDLESFFLQGIEQQEVFKQLTEANNNLIHKVFVQNPAGVELLTKWKNDLIMQPSVLPHFTQFEAGIAEGVKVFIRNIIIQSESVEKDL